MRWFAIVLLNIILGCGGDSMKVKTIPGEVLPWGEAGRSIELLGPSGQVVELEGDGVNTIQWAPLDRHALEVEVRVRILGWTNPAGITLDPPILRARLAYGHGRLSWQDPFLPPPFSAGSLPFVNYGVPARGVVWRLAAREIKVLLQSPYRKTGGAAYPKTSVYVSFLPVAGMDRPRGPQNEFAYNPGDGNFYIHAFPQGATEWRLFQDTGLPWPAASGNVIVAGLAGDSYNVALDAAADWVPLPYDGIGFVVFPGQNVYAEYR